jgi:hypothetical protein
MRTSGALVVLELAGEAALLVDEDVIVVGIFPFGVLPLRPLLVLRPKKVVLFFGTSCEKK